MSTTWFLVSTYVIWIFGVQIDPVKQPIKRDSVGSAHVSSFDNHFDDSFVVFKNAHLNFELREFCACDNVIHIRQFINFSVTAYFQFGVGISRTGTSSAYKA